MDRRTVALGIAAAAAVTAAVVVALPKRHHVTERDKVAAYIGAVNTIQNDDLHRPLTRLTLAYAHFSRAGALGHREVAQLQAGRTTLLRVRRRIAALPAPPAAARLRARLLRLVAADAAVTGEVAELAAFLPRFDRMLRRVSAADARLAQDLKKVKAPVSHALHGTKKQIAAAQAVFAAESSRTAAAQADIVDTYDASLADTAKALRTLHPPAPFAPAYRAQLRAIDATTVAGSRLSTELRKAQRPNVTTLSRAFATASRVARSLTAQRAEISALRAYNARVRSIGTATAAVQREVTKLQQTLR